MVYRKCAVFCPSCICNV